MKLFILAVIFLSLYLLYRLCFPKQAEKPQGKETLPPEALEGYEAVIKNRFVLPSLSNSAQHDDSKPDSDKPDEKAFIFAAENGKPDTSVVQNDELDGVFSEEVNPEDLEIEPDESETVDDEELDADEEAEELRQSVGVIEGYAEGITYDELREILDDAGKHPKVMKDATIETLRSILKTDMFEQLASSGEGRFAQIASVLNRSEKNLAHDEGETDDKDLIDFNIEQCLVK